MSESGLIQAAVKITWRLFATRASEALNTGDIVDEKIRNLLLSEFQKIHESLDSLRRKELVAAIGYLETGFELIDKDLVTSKDEFKKARENAQMAFGVVQSVDYKLLAVKILIVSSVHEFFSQPDTKKTLCLKYVSRLNSLPEIMKACSVYFENKMSVLNRTSKIERQNLIRTAAHINAIAYEYLRETEESSELLNEWPPIELQSRKMHAIHDLALFRRNQTVAVMLKEIESIVDAVVCCKQIFAAVGSASDESLRNNILCISVVTGHVKHLPGHQKVVLSLATKDNLLFSGSYDRCVMIWDALSRDCIHVIRDSEGSVGTLCISDQWLYAGSSDGNLRCYSIEDLPKQKEIYDCEAPISRITCSKTKFVFVLTGLQKVQIWDMTNNKKLQEISSVNNCCRLIVSENQLLCISSSGEINPLILGSLQFGNQKMTVSTKAIALNDTNRLVYSGGQLISIWDMKYKKCCWKDEVYYKSEKVARIKRLWFDMGSLYGVCQIKNGHLAFMKW